VPGESSKSPPSGSKTASLELEPTGPGCAGGPQSAEAHQLSGTVIRPRGFLLGLDPEPSSPNPDLEAPPQTPEASRWRAGEEDGSQEAEVGAVPKLGSSSPEDKGPSGRRTPRGPGYLRHWERWPWGPPAEPGDTPRSTEEPERAGCGATGQATPGTARLEVLARPLQGATPAPRSSLSRLYLCVADYGAPGRPESASHSSAAAGCAHGNAAGTPGQGSSRRCRPRPGNCRHAPDDRLCHAPNL
jgi:hypothetical protein